MMGQGKRPIRVSREPGERRETLPGLYPEATGMYDGKGIWAGTPDRAYTFRVTGFVHLDSRFNMDLSGHNPTESDMFWRRARITLDGRLPYAFEYRLMWDNLIDPLMPYDFHIDWRPMSEFNIRLGGFKSSFSLERRARSYALTTIERGHPSSLAPNRDLGIFFYGQTKNGLFSYDVSLASGAIDLDVLTDYYGTPDFAGRVYFLPFRLFDELEALQNLGIGFSWTVGNEFGDASNSRLGVLRKAPRRSAFAGRFLLDWARGPDGTAVAHGFRDRQGVQLHWSHKQNQVFAEYHRSAQVVALAQADGTIDNHQYLAHQAWQVWGSHTYLKGDKNGFFGVYPKKPFNLKKKQYGGFTSTVRYHGIRFDPNTFPLYGNSEVSVLSNHGFLHSFQWHVNSMLELQFDQEINVSRMADPSTQSHPPELMLGTRVELRY